MTIIIAHSQLVDYELFDLESDYVLVGTTMNPKDSNLHKIIVRK